MPAIPSNSAFEDVALSMLICGCGCFSEICDARRDCMGPGIGDDDANNGVDEDEAEAARPLAATLRPGVDLFVVLGLGEGDATDMSLTDDSSRAATLETEED